VNCPFGTYDHADCGRHSECRRTDKHHHHLSPAEVEVISPGTADECWETFFGKGRAT